MEAWQLWLAMARESEDAARLSEVHGHLRSAASRYYYSAYQIVTALLLYRGLTPPIGREAWNHDDTPLLIKDQLRPLIPSQGRRNDLAQRMVALYQLRVQADYQGQRRISAETSSAAGKDTRYLVSVCEGILPTAVTQTPP